MNIYKIEDDGSINELGDTKVSLSDDTAVYIIVDSDEKNIWLWKGSRSGVRTKFSGSQAMNNLRTKSYGMTYKTRTIDQGDETRDFKKIREKIDDGTEMQSGSSIEEVSSTDKEEYKKESPQKREKEDIKQEEPMYTSKGEEEVKAEGNGKLPHVETIIKSDKNESRKTITSYESFPLADQLPSNKEEKTKQRKDNEETLHLDEERQQKNTKTHTQTLPIPSTKHGTVKGKDSSINEEGKMRSDSEQKLVKKCWNIIKDLQVPENTIRDSVVIGSYLYVEEENGLRKSEELLDNISPKMELTPRLICENGKIIAIEFLKKEN